MKKPRPFRLLVLAILSLFFCQLATAQKTKKKSPEPSWIAMMDDPNVNYHVAVKAFENYWKGKEKPMEENELFETAEEMAKEKELLERAKQLGEDNPTVIYAFEYKRFMMWKNNVEPFVKNDGHIQNMDERIANWKAAKEQKKLQEQKNQKK